MLFRKMTAGIILAAILLLSACAAPKGGIVILENPQTKGFTMEFRKYNEKDKCKLSLAEGDELLVEVTRDSGKIALAVSGRNGSEPYTGNDLRTGTFTVTVHETDEYEFTITGKDATGKISVKNLGSDAK